MANENGNGTTESKRNLLSELHAAFEAGGSKTPDAKTNGALVKAWQAASAKRDAAEKAYREATKAESDAVAAIIRANGKGRIGIAGVTYIPMSRGDTAYLRREGGGEVRTIG
jgi:hypothetical protein